MVRYFLTDFMGNPIYSFATHQQRGRLRGRHHPLQRFQNRLSAHFLNNNNNATTTSSSSTDSLFFYSTTLVCMVRNRAWDDVRIRIGSHPHERDVLDDSSGNTVLHVACRLNPPADIVMLLALPHLVRTTNAEGATPLHLAASHRCNAAALKVLLEAGKLDHNHDDDDNNNNHSQHTNNNSTNHNNNSHHNKHVSPTADLSRMGRAPIHYACMSFRGLEMDSFELLLSTTLQEGNVWVRPQPKETVPAHPLSEYNDDDDDDNDDVRSWDDSLYVQYEQPEEEEADEDADHNSSTIHNHHDDTWSASSSYQQQPTASPHIRVNVMGLKDATGQTPLGLLFRRYRERVRCVITTVDQLRSRQHRDNNSHHQASLVAAIRVHADLGELWEKARFIVARLTEERLSREVPTAADDADGNHHHHHQEEGPHKKQPPPSIRDATSRRATYYGNVGAATHTWYNPGEFAEPPSPAELAVSFEAARFAAEQHTTERRPPKFQLLPLAEQVSTKGHSTFRIVHASVGLTGYGCPPELVRLAISIHPHQVTEMDEDGNLPLHIAVTAASYLASTAHSDRAEMMHAAVAAAAGPDDDHSVLSDAAMSFFSSATVSQTTNPFDKVIKILLEHYPESAKIPQGKTGRLPLVLAIESGRRTWQDGIRTLLNAYPPALHSKKVMEKNIYPHVLSLMAASSNHGPGSIVDVLPDLGVLQQQPRSSQRRIRHEQCSRTTLFEVLRTKPEWLTNDEES